MRGAEPTALSSVKVNNEIAFCAVTNKEQKDLIERLFLKNGISYFVRWEERGFFQKMFHAQDDRNIFVICIHDAYMDKAKELVSGMEGVKVLVS